MILIILKDHFSCKMEKRLEGKRRDLSGEYLYQSTREDAGLDSVREIEMEQRERFEKYGGGK